MYRAEETVFAGRAHRELVHVRLAYGYGMHRAEPLDHGGIVWRHEHLEHARRARGANSICTEYVLVDKGNAAEQGRAVHGDCRIGSHRGGQRLGRAESDQGIEASALAGVGDRLPGKLDRRGLACAQCQRQLRNSWTGHAPYSMTLGTRNRPPRASGASASNASARSGSATRSSRHARVCACG